MSTTTRLSDDADLFTFFRAIAAGNVIEVSRALDSSGNRFALEAIRVGSTRQDPTTYFLSAVRRHVYAGDTGLHIAAAAHGQRLAQLLIDKGSSVRARNRRGAEPLHYAADGNPDGPLWAPDAQREVIACLIANGADPNARDSSGVAPLHRAVRNRCSAAVRVLLENGADPLMTNKSGSRPLHLAVQNTGRGASGTTPARKQQARIVELLLEHGARPTDTDAKGKTVLTSAASPWVRDLIM